MKRRLHRSFGVLLAAALLAPASLAPAGAAGTHPAATTHPRVPVHAAISTATAAAPRHCKVPAKRSNAPTSGIVGVTITTVPPSSAARFQLDGHPLSTNAKGVASGNANCAIARHVLKLLNPATGTDRRFTFVRWAGPIDHDQQHRSVISDLAIHRDIAVQAGFNVTYALKYRFVTPAGRPVPMKRVTAMTVKGSTGSQQRTRGGVIRVSGLSVRQSGSHLVATPVIQRIERVDIDGSNAVFASAHKFAPDDVWRKKQTLTIPVLLFSIHIEARSRLRKQPVGTALVLTYPNGRTVRAAMKHGDVTLDNLVRGDYVVNVETPGGLRVARPVRLSSSQYLNLTVLTSDDKNIMIFVVVLALIVLIAIRLLSRRAQTRRTPPSPSPHV